MQKLWTTADDDDDDDHINHVMKKEKKVADRTVANDLIKVHTWVIKKNI